MAKEPTVSRKTPEEIAAMEEEIRQYHSEAAAEAAQARLDAGKPIADLAGSDALKEVRAALPDLYRLAADKADLFPSLRTALDAINNGASLLTEIAPAEPAVNVKP